MKTFAPDYYKNFRCIADKCKHSCCCGWEIDIDEESYEKYQKLPGKTGDDLRSNIAVEEDGTVHFVMKKGLRCPFLREDNLCRMIIELGEDSLCQICADHPRFRNFWTEFTEIGLGLACEAAGKLILGNSNRVQLAEIENDGIETEEAADEYEEDLLDLRAELFEILQDRSHSTDERVAEMLRYCGINKALPAFAKGETDDIACEQLAVYLLYRHYADALYDGRLQDRIFFAAENYVKVRNRWAQSPEKSLDAMVEIARQFSEEVEYDTDTWGEL